MTLEVCSEELAKGVLGEVQSLLLDHGFSEDLDCTWLARTQDGENDKNRRYYALAKFYAPDKVAKTPKEKELEAAMGKLQRATHFKYVQAETLAHALLLCTSRPSGCCQIQQPPHSSEALSH